MKYKIQISLLLLFSISNWNCKDKTVFSVAAKNEEVIDSTLQQDSLKPKKSVEITEYDKKWVRYVDNDGLIISELEFYVSEFGDTLCWNSKIYKDGVLDYAQSNFYEFEANMTKDSIIKGRVTLFSNLDHKIRDTIIEKELEVDFINNYLDEKKVITFKSKNQNYVDFEFKNNNDTIIGMLMAYRQVELNQSPDSARLIFSKYPIDNKSHTNNPFIHFHKLN